MVHSPICSLLLVSSAGIPTFLLEVSIRPELPRSGTVVDGVLDIFLASVRAVLD
jgi:hypothetical protein